MVEKVERSRGREVEPKKKVEKIERSRGREVEPKKKVEKVESASGGSKSGVDIAPTMSGEKVKMTEPNPDPVVSNEDVKMTEPNPDPVVNNEDVEMITIKQIGYLPPGSAIRVRAGQVAEYEASGKAKRRIG